MEYDERLLYKLWLNIQCGHDPRLIEKCLNKFGSAEEIFKSEPKYTELLSGVRMGRVLSARRSLSQAEELVRYCEEEGIEIIAQGDKKYPKRLSEIFAPPQILYVKGEMPDIDNLVCVTVVGSRECTEYSRKFARDISYDLAKSGIIVISGMARGIDAAAQTGALDAGSITVAALAGGVDVIYPKSNAPLYKRIVEQGAIISERPPQTAGRKEFYRERNRILVGLSKGVVIVAGEEKSGTRLTATWAGDANRDLFAVPGKPDDVGSALPNRLIKENAKLTTTAEDVIEEYISVYQLELKNGIDYIDEKKAKSVERAAIIGVEELPRPKAPDFDKFEDKERIILEFLYENKKAVHIDDIAEGCNIPTTELSFLIIQLLMQRAVKEHPGERYSIE